MSRRAALAALLLAGAWELLDGFHVAPQPAAACVAAVAGLLLAWRGAREGMWRALIVVALHTGMLPLLAVASAHLHAIPASGGVAALAARLLGLEAAASRTGHLLVQTDAGTAQIDLSCELAALPFVLRLCAGLVVMAPPGGRAAALATACGFAAGRAVIMALLLAGGARMPVSWEPLWLLASFAPFAVVMRSGSGEEPPRPTRLVPMKAVAALGLMALAGAGAGLGWRADAPAPARRARVLIDESHSNWEWTGIPFDHARYGQRSLYNYALWRRWIELHHETRVLERTPQESDLRSADIVVIKTPTSPYEQAEIARLERFVSRGGGLYLIGDHTNLFGMSVVLNALARPYKIAFRFDDTFPLDHEEGDVFVPGLLSHPIVNGLGPYPFETSCTLEVPWSAHHVMIGRRLGAEPVDYGHPNFFGDIRLQPSERSGLFVQAAGVEHAKGRVLAFSDSTNFSNFSMLWPGRRDLTLRILGWLAPREPAGPGGRAPIWWAAAALAGLGGALMLRGAGHRAAAAAVWCALLAGAAGAWAGATHGKGLGIPQPREPIRTIAFDMEHADPGLDPVSPVLGSPRGAGWDRFNALFINAARSGLWPEAAHDLSAAMRSHDRIVMVNPRRRLSSVQEAELRSWVRLGGRLLVLDSIRNEASTASGLLAPYGLAPVTALRPLAGEESATAPALDARAAPESRAVSLSGGGRAVIRRYGRGTVILAHDAALWSDFAAGGVYVAATPQREEIYRGHRGLIDLLDAAQPP